MPLNQSKTPASSLLYSAFAFLSSSLFRPPSLGHRCQTGLLCAGVRFCSPSPACVWTSRTCRCCKQQLLRMCASLAACSSISVCVSCACISSPSPGSSAMCLGCLSAQRNSKRDPPPTFSFSPRIGFLHLCYSSLLLTPVGSGALICHNNGAWGKLRKIKKIV